MLSKFTWLDKWRAFILKAKYSLLYCPSAARGHPVNWIKVFDPPPPTHPHTPSSSITPNKTPLIGWDLFSKTCFGRGTLLCGLILFKEGTVLISCCEIQVWRARHTRTQERLTQIAFSYDNCSFSRLSGRSQRFGQVDLFLVSLLIRSNQQNEWYPLQTLTDFRETIEQQRGGLKEVFPCIVGRKYVFILVHNCHSQRWDGRLTFYRDGDRNSCVTKEKDIEERTLLTGAYWVWMLGVLDRVATLWEFHFL